MQIKFSNNDSLNPYPKKVFLRTVRIDSKVESIQAAKRPPVRLLVRLMPRALRRFGGGGVVEKFEASRSGDGTFQGSRLHICKDTPKGLKSCVCVCFLKTKYDLDNSHGNQNITIFIYV